MPAVLGAAVGFLYPIMNLFNARLSQAYGNPLATVMIHVTGLACVLPFALRHLPGRRHVPLWMYLGGLLGIFTVVTSNLGITVLGVTATLSLTLLGQMACSMAFDQFGLMGFTKTRFKWEKAAGLLLIAMGVAVMMVW